MSELIELKVLSNDALPIDENDWGSERQVEAETKFWDALKAQIGEENYDKLSEDIESLKMDVDAMIYFALARLNPDFRKSCNHDMQTDLLVSNQSTFRRYQCI
jgi:hypothetical protein